MRSNTLRQDYAPLPFGAEPDNADLWGLDPTTGRLYTTRDRRTQLENRGVRGTPGGPAPSAMWDDYTDRVYGQMHGLGADFQAPVVGNQLSPSAQALNQQLMKRARSAESEFQGGVVEGGMGSGMGVAPSEQITRRPSMTALKTPPEETRRRKGMIANQDQRAANFYPNAGK